MALFLGTAQFLGCTEWQVINSKTISKITNNKGNYEDFNGTNLTWRIRRYW